ncbi:Nucleolar protein 58 [Desmophyllum pertusum]|uniref:Nucleolar protein 58 n=1 Tax=Desmophyllum pertusum TaxID=174260 RepID=A0A9X0D9A3_9CNID|nr:Nucleolar protein 58 [Desmophyllum pertusum]
MLVLFETPAGYAIFKLLDEKKLQKIDNLYKDFETPDAASKVCNSYGGRKNEQEPKKGFEEIVAKDIHQELAVADAKLGGVIKEKLSLNCVSNSAVHELMRGIRLQLDSLITGNHHSAFLEDL